VFFTLRAREEKRKNKVKHDTQSVIDFAHSLVTQTIAKFLLCLLINDFNIYLYIYKKGTKSRQKPVSLINFRLNSSNNSE